MYLKNIVQRLCCSFEEEFELPSTKRTSHSDRSIRQERPKNERISFRGSTLVSRKKYISPLPNAEQPYKFYSLNKKNNKKCLLIDLDRTLIYFTEERGFLMRPHLNRFLKNMEQFYNIFIFTAATESYLERMKEEMKRNKAGIQYISGFLTRENCLQVQTNDEKTAFIKDINVIEDCEASKIVVVDDLPITYCLNPDNAVPILPFEGETLDNHLFFLAQTLMEIKDYEDVREYIRGRYVFNSLSPETTSPVKSSSEESPSKRGNDSFQTISTNE